jgi:hypothetical protein
MSVLSPKLANLQKALAAVKQELEVAQGDTGEAWIGVDFDGTLAHYDGWKGDGYLGEPVPLMVARVRGWLAQGKKVKIVTARVSHNGTPEGMAMASTNAVLISQWCARHIGVALEVTCSKDYAMISLWDDRCVQVIQNTGQPVMPEQQIMASVGTKEFTLK